MVKRLVTRYPARRPADYECQARPGADPVHTVRARYPVQVPRQCIPGLDEKNRPARWLFIGRVTESVRQLVVMPGVIQRDTDYCLAGNG